MWSDLSANSLTHEEIEFCMHIFANAIITNLVDKGAQADLDTLFSNSLACYTTNKFDTIYLSQLLKQNKLPEPSSKCIYVVSDVSDAAKSYDMHHDAQTKSENHTDLQKNTFFVTASACAIL